MSTKKDKLLGANTRIKDRKENPPADKGKADLAKNFKSPSSKYVRSLFTITRQQNKDLAEKVTQFDDLPMMDVNKSLLVRVGIDMLLQKEPKEILRIISGI